VIDGSTTSRRHSVDAIVERLSALPGKSNLFNPYAGFDAEIEGADAPAIRRRNLGRYLAAMADRDVRDLWLGEAPSRFGARRTGVPFTGDGRLADLSQRLGLDPPLARATRETLPTPESGTSREIWDAVPDPLHCSGTRCSSIPIAAFCPCATGRRRGPRSPNIGRCWR